MALASAYRPAASQPRPAPDPALVARQELRGRRPAQMLARFGDVLTQDDHVRRADILLYGAQGPAARGHDRPAARRPAGRRRGRGWRCAPTPTNANDARHRPAAGRRDQPGRRLRARRLPAPARPRQPGARPAAALPQASGHTPEMADRHLGRAPAADPARRCSNGNSHARLRRRGQQRPAPAASTRPRPSSTPAGSRLRRLNDPGRPTRHFAAIERIGTSPITRGRALYWRGRAAEARGRPGRGRRASTARRRAPHHLLRPARRREGRATARWCSAAIRSSTRGRPRALRGPRHGPGRAPAGRRGPARPVPGLRRWRSTTSCRRRGAGPAGRPGARLRRPGHLDEGGPRRRPSAASSCPSAAIPTARRPRCSARRSRPWCWASPARRAASTRWSAPAPARAA